jgi:hypothetical protein
MTESSPSACVDLYLGALCDADKATFCEAWHAGGLRLGLTVDGAVIKQNVDQVWESKGTPIDGRLLSMTTISETCACAKVRIIEPSQVVITEFVTMLKDKHDAWKIIAVAHSSVAASGGGGGGAVHRKIIPRDFSQVSGAVWGGYVAAGRACDAVAMGNVFHPVSNLTHADDDGNVAVISSDDFCKNVAKRWSNEVHRPYAHLKNDSRIAAADTLLSVDFASPDVAMVSLNIGYPPFLYTDVLLLLRLSQSVPERPDSNPGWWIVAKSSDNTPWMTDESKPAL